MKSQGSGSQCRVEKGAEEGDKGVRGVDTEKNVDTIPTTKYKYTPLEPVNINYI